MWRAIPGWEGLYEVSDAGQVRSLPGGRRKGAPLVPEIHGGYERVTLSDLDRSKRWRVHVLVLTAFRGPRPTGMVTRHLDGNPRNNRLDNLAWGTRSENEADKKRHGTLPPKRSHCGKNIHELTPENTYVKPTGARACRECRSAGRRRAKASATP